MSISSISSTNYTYLANSKMEAKGPLPFKGKKENETHKKSNKGLYGVAALAILTTLGIIFRKNISKSLGLGKNASKEIVNESSLFADSLIKNIKHSKNIKLENVIEEILPYRDVPNLEKAFMLRLSKDMKTQNNIVAKDGLAVGYFVKGQNEPVLKRILTCDELSEEIIEQFGGKDLVCYL